MSWQAIGASVATFALLLNVILGTPSGISPQPVHVLLMLFSIGPFALFVPTSLFLLQFKLRLTAADFLFVQLLYLVSLWLITPFYFRHVWEDGVNWMGQAHTLTVSAIHIVGLIILTGLAGAVYRTRRSTYVNILNVAIFFFLFWCAFPYLGELP